jgi:DNA invertase Pin-like site-specific DNA recombinase
VTGNLIGYARCSTDKQDLTDQRGRLCELNVAADRVYLDHGLTGLIASGRELREVLAAVRSGDTLVVPKLDRLVRPVSDAHAIGDELTARGVKLSLGGRLYDPSDPGGKMCFNILATFAEFEVGLLRTRTCEGMAVAKAKGKLQGKKPKLSDKQQRELRRMHGTGGYSIADLAEVFCVPGPRSTGSCNACRPRAVHTARSCLRHEPADPRPVNGRSDSEPKGSALKCTDHDEHTRAHHRCP